MGLTNDVIFILMSTHLTLDSYKVVLIIVSQFYF